MIELTTSAPGKAIVAGEYAVLHGAPAISMALNRRAYVRLVEKPGSAHSVSAPGYLKGSFRFHPGETGLSWIDKLPTSDALGLFEAVWQQSEITEDRGLSFVLDTREFFDAETGSKLGIGSSAALATALAAAVINAGSLSCSIESLAADSHRKFQAGLGSGVDIATAVHGGVIGYRMDNPAESLKWPDGLAYRILWSGHAVSTAGKLANNSWQRNPSGPDRLGEASRDVTVAWQSGDKVQLLAELRRYTTALQAYSTDHDLGIFEAGHKELASMAENYPMTVYKPCGTGGGDIGIVLAKSMKDVDLFTEDAVKSGFSPLSVSLDTNGVLIESKVL